MKKIFTFVTLLFFLLTACNKNIKKAEQKQQKNADSPYTKFGIPNEFYGHWLNKAYVDKLRETKSTRKSQDVSGLCLVSIEIRGDSTVMATSWNFHEGGDSPILIMTAKDKATSKSKYNWTDPFQVTLNMDNTINIKYDDEDNDYVKFGKETEYSTYKEIINEILFSGNYLLNDSISIEMHNNGEIIGLKEYESYKVIEDYIDAGMDYDQISFTLKNQAESTFGFEIHDKTIEIFRLGCKKFDPQDDTFCNEHTRKETIYKLIKK